MRVRGPVAPCMTVHPRTGEPIVPVGYVDGRPIYPIMGGAPDDDDDDDDDGDDGDDADKKKKSKDDVGSRDSGADADDDEDDRLAQLEKRMKAADRRADEAERKLKEKEKAELGELERAKTELTEVQEELEKTQETVNRLRLENAFLTANTHKWHDPDTALDLAQSKGYLEDVLDENGEVDKKALKKALDRLATEKKFLVQSEEKKKDDEPGEPSGEPAGGRSDNSKDDKARKDSLKRRFPSIAR